MSLQNSQLSSFSFFDWDCSLVQIVFQMMDNTHWPVHDYFSNFARNFLTCRFMSISVSKCSVKSLSFCVRSCRWAYLGVSSGAVTEFLRASADTHMLSSGQEKMRQMCDKNIRPYFRMFPVDQNFKMKKAWEYDCGRVNQASVISAIWLHCQLKQLIQSWHNLIISVCFKIYKKIQNQWVHYDLIWFKLAQYMSKLFNHILCNTKSESLRHNLFLIQSFEPIFNLCLNENPVTLCLQNGR